MLINVHLDGVHEMNDLAKVPPHMWTRMGDRSPLDYAEEQRWTECIGHSHTFGNGQALSPRLMFQYQSIVSCQVFVKPLIAHLLDVDTALFEERICGRES